MSFITLVTEIVIVIAINKIISNSNIKLHYRQLLTIHSHLLGFLFATCEEMINPDHFIS